MIPFCVQDFGSFSLSLFRILYQVEDRIRISEIEDRMVEINESEWKKEK